MTQADPTSEWEEPLETGAGRPPQEPSAPETPAPPTPPVPPDASELATESEASEEPAGEDEVEDDLARAQRDLADLTGDLQRLQAEYLNYKRRVDRDRELVRENATYAALTPITEVLDTIDRAREHGPLEEGLRAVADQLERTVAGLGLVKFGEVGDPFDPSLHEALSHIGEDPEVAVTTCKVVVRAGYRMGDRVLRAAQVLVVDPASGSGDPDGPAAGPAPGASEGSGAE